MTYVVMTMFSIVRYDDYFLPSLYFYCVVFYVCDLFALQTCCVNRKIVTRNIGLTNDK